MGSRNGAGSVPHYVFVADRRSGVGHVVDRHSFGVPAALTLCGHRIDLRAPVTFWEVGSEPGERAECLRCLRSIR